jgi:hypothetical protein
MLKNAQLIENKFVIKPVQRKFDRICAKGE